MKITGIRGVVYEFPLTRRIGDVHYPAGTDRGTNVAVFVDTDEGITGQAVGFAQAGRELGRFEHCSSARIHALSAACGSACVRSCSSGDRRRRARRR
jgi:hypothetical protein